MSRVKFCIEKDNPYGLDRLEKVLGENFWETDEELKNRLKALVVRPKFETLKEVLKALKEVLKALPHAPVYDKEHLKGFEPNVLLITNEPGLNKEVVENLYLKALKPFLHMIKSTDLNDDVYRAILDLLIDRFNTSMFSWLNMTPLPELKGKINGEGLLKFGCKYSNMDCASIITNLLKNKGNAQNKSETDSLVCCFKKISYWIPNDKSDNKSDDESDNESNSSDDCRNEWLNFLKGNEIKVIHWDMLPYAEDIYKDGINCFDLEIENIASNLLNKKYFVNNIEYATFRDGHRQAYWFAKLLRNFLDVLEKSGAINSIEYILVTGNKIHITRHQHFVSSLLIYMIIFPIFLYTFCERYLK